MVERICGLLVGYLIGNIRGRILCKCFIADIIDMAKAIFPVVLIVNAYYVKYGGESVAVFCSLYYLELGTVLGHDYPFFLKDIGDNCMAIYWGIILLLTSYNPWLTLLCIAVFWGEIYVSRNRLRAVKELIITFIGGYVIGSYFGHYGPMEWILLEFNVIIIIISVITYGRYKSTIEVGDMI